MRFDLKEGDTSPYLRIQCLDGLGRPVSLSGATVTFRMRPVVSSLRAAIEQPAVVVDAARGLVEYRWRDSVAVGGGNAGDSDIPGVYRVDFFVYFSGGGPGQSFPGDDDISVVVHKKP